MKAVDSIIAFNLLIYELLLLLPMTAGKRAQKAAHDSKARRKKKKLAKVKRELICDFCPTLDADKPCDEEAREIKE